MQHLLAIAKNAALDAGMKIMPVYHSARLHVREKEGGSPVTIADKNSHTIIARHLEKTGYPVLSEEGSHIDFSNRKHWEHFWLVDPLDGTKEFISANDEFTINIALMERGVPVAGVIYAPAMATLYYGSRETGVFKNVNGELNLFPRLPERKIFNDLLQKEHITVAVSRSHLSEATNQFVSRFQHATLSSMGSSLKFMMLLENKADIYPRLGYTMEWDTAAAHALLNASNRGIYRENLQSELTYNKPDLRNPFFIAF